MPFACIYVPDFSVAAIMRAEPDLRSQAVVVLAGKPPLEKVYGVNEKAQRMGIEPGMSKTQVEICEELVLRPRSALQESAAHTALVNCAQSFSPCVEDTAADTVLLDLAGIESLFGPLPQIARDLAHRATQLGLEANVGVAVNPDSAQLAARGFFGVTVIPAGKEAELLGNLPLEVLFSGSSEAALTPEAEQLLDTFCRWGIRNLRALAALPEVALSERLGQEGVRLQKLARGAASRMLVPVEPPLAFEETIELEYPLMLLEPLAFALNHMLEQICARLAAHALATQELRLELELENSVNSRHKFQRTLRLPVPLLDARVFLKLLQLDLKAHPPGAPILKIHLRAEPARPRVAQSGLFLPPAPEPEKLELTMARIAGIVGEEKVGSLEMLDTHRPEGFRMRRFAPVAPQGLKPISWQATTAALKRCSTQNPSPNGGGSAKLDFDSHSLTNSERSDAVVTVLRIFRPALRVSVTLRDDQPARIVCDKQKEVQGEVIWAAGPWRSSGDWWAQEGWRRDEWDIAVQNETGIGLYRLVCDLLRGCWLVEGTYD